MKTYRRHNCERQHRSTRTFMQCAIRNAVWVTGEGRYATISWCSGPSYRHHGPSVMLHETLDQAQKAVAFIDRFGCGGGCSKQHEIVEVAM